MKKPSNEIVELGKEREEIKEMIELQLLTDDTGLRTRLDQINRELAIRWNNMICD